MAKKTSSQIVLDIFLRESPEVCEQLIGVAKSALKSRRAAGSKPVARAARKVTATEQDIMSRPSSDL